MEFLKYLAIIYIIGFAFTLLAVVTENTKKELEYDDEEDY